MDSKSLDLLEFPRVREIIAQNTSFSTSRELVLSLQPSSDYERISLLLKQSAEARRLLSLQPDFSVGGITDIREKVKMAARNKVLEPQDLVEIQHTVSALRHLRRSLRQIERDFPLLYAMAVNITEIHDLEKDISVCLTPAGEILDSASEKLSSTRRQLREKRERLLIHLDAILKSPRIRKIIQEPIITEREGRYVIPIKIEFRKELKGIVHDISNTGATVFIEPWAMIEIGNEVRELALEEKYEVERILAELSARVGEHEFEIEHSIRLAAEIDLTLAKARYARKSGAIEPAITVFDSNEGGIIKLVEARHPLLGEKAVPLSVEMGKDYAILVITGPNTGGKTVALKTIGLLSLMALAGLPVPAAPGSSIPVFDGIFADIGDEQSIEQTLSSFSWHMGNIVRILNQVNGKSLVLLDELGASTDPAEGSALARSILLHILSRHAMAVATTHYSDLKAFAHARASAGFQNASLDFDPVTLTPTYHLMIGIPGGSNALATASRLGLAPEIIDRARDMLSRGSQELEALLSDLTVQKRSLEALQKEVQKEKSGIEQKKAELEKEIKRLKSEERRAILEARDRISRNAAELHRLIREAESDLRKEKSQERIEQAKQALARSRETLKDEFWQIKAGEETDGSRIVAGDTVVLKEAAVRATVLSVSGEDRQIEVQAGATRMRLSLDSVEKVAVSAKPVQPSFPAIPVELSKRKVLPELDLRGKRAEEIESLLDSYLNNASLANLSQVRIVHGIGTGALRRITRDFLAAHPLVKSFRSGGRDEGGDGATVVSL